MVASALAMLGAVALLVRARGLGVADQLASVASLLVGVASLSVAVWLGRGAHGSAVDETELLGRAADRLAELVRRQWDDEVGARGLRDPRPIRVRWSSTGRPVGAPADSVVGPQRLTGGRALRLKLAGDLTGVADTVRRLPARQLVVLGEPGAGKSVLAMLFTLAELRQRKPSEPVPVLLPVAGWDPRREHLHAWLARRIDADYPGLKDARAYGPNAATRLVRAGRVIPVLDGLDEMPASLIPAAIAALNVAIGESGAVLTCRSRDYEDIVVGARTTLSRAAVIEIQPVTVGDAIAFLTGAEPVELTRWQPVVRHLRSNPDGVLTRTLSTPFMISIARSVCAPGGTDPAELVALAGSTSTTAVGQELIRRFVPTVYADGLPRPAGAPTRARYRPDRVAKWLAFLAHHLQGRIGSPDLAWWQLAVAVPAWLTGTVAGVAAGLLSAAMMSAGLGMWLSFSLFEQAWLVGVYSLMVGLPVGLTAARSARVLAEPPRRRRAAEQIAQGLRDVLAIAAVTAPFLIPIGENWAERLPLGVLLWMCAAVLAGIAGGLQIDGSTAPRRVSLGLRGLGRNVVAPLASGFLAGLAIGVPIAAFFASDPRFGDTATSRVLFTLLAAGMIGVGTIGLPLALGRWLQSSVDEDRAVTPRSVLRADRRAFTVVALGAGLLVVPFVLVVDSSLFFAAGVGIPIAAALAPVTATAAAPARVCYMAARSWLAIRGRLPWRLMRFLTDAHNREVLRQAGSVYQFRHALLQDHCAGRWRHNRSVRHPAAVLGRPARLRPWLRRTATAVPVVLLLTGTWAAVDHALAGLRAEAVRKLLQNAHNLQDADPVTALRLRRAALALEPVERSFDDVQPTPSQSVDDLLPLVLRYNGTVSMSRLPHETNVVIISRDGGRLATISPKKKATLWRIDSRGHLRDPVPLPDEFVTSVKFTASGPLIVGLHGTEVKVWTWSSAGRPALLKRFAGPANALDVGIDGDTITTLDEDGTLRRWSWTGARTTGPGRPVHPGLPPRQTWVSLSDDGSTAVGLDLSAVDIRPEGSEAEDTETTEETETAEETEAAKENETAEAGTGEIEIEDNEPVVIVRRINDGATAPLVLPFSSRPRYPALNLAYDEGGYFRRDGEWVTRDQLSMDYLLTAPWTWAINLPSSMDAVALTASRVALLADDGSMQVTDPSRLQAAIAAFQSDPSGYVCAHIHRGLNRQEWRQQVPYSWLPEHAYRPTCP